MAWLVVKVLLTTGLVVAVSEVSKRSTFFGGLLASVPLVSVLAMIWLYLDTADAQKVSALSTSIFWLVLPTLPFFLLLPALLKHQHNFYLSLGISLGAMLCLYLLMVALLRKFGVEL